MRIFCWNVNSLVPTLRNVELRHKSLAHWFDAVLDADIVCLQEVKLPSAKLTKELVVVPGYRSYWACSEGKTGYSGVTTWARERVAPVAAEADPLEADGCEREGRCVLTDHGCFVLLNVYVPNAGDRPARARLGAKLAFLAALRARVDDLHAAGRKVVVVGDLNVAAERRDVHAAIAWEGLYDPREPAALASLLAAGGLADAWRERHPDAADVFSVWDEKKSARAFNVGLRIDYALVSRALLPAVASCEVVGDMPPKWSDHAPVALVLDAEPPPGAPRAHCALWRAALKRFADPAQRSIAAMFKAAPRRAAPGGGGGAGGGGGGASGGGGSSSTAKRPREEEPAADATPAKAAKAAPVAAPAQEEPAPQQEQQEQQQQQQQQQEQQQEKQQEKQQEQEQSQQQEQECPPRTAPPPAKRAGTPAKRGGKAKAGVVLPYERVVDPDADLTRELVEGFGPDGLGILTVSGVPGFAELRQRLLPLAAEFAALPEHVKAAHEHAASSYNVGWSHGKEALRSGRKDVHKGSFYANPLRDTYEDVDPAEAAAYPSYYSANVWPRGDLPGLEPAVKALGRLIVDVGLALAHHCAKYVRTQLANATGAPLDAEQAALLDFAGELRASRCHKARLLHYFPAATAAGGAGGGAGGDEDWCGWHLDHGALTGLCSAMYTAGGAVVPCPDPCAGLYICDRGGEVVQAAIPAGHIGYQVGQVMAIQSGGLLRATPHYVRAAAAGPPGVGRSTFAVFMQPETAARLHAPRGADALGALLCLDSGHWSPGMSFGEFAEATMHGYYAPPLAAGAGKDVAPAAVHAAADAASRRFAGGRLQLLVSHDNAADDAALSGRSSARDPPPQPPRAPTRDAGAMWPEIQAAIDGSRHELRLTGKALDKRLEEDGASAPPEALSTALDAKGVPLFTFIELSGSPLLKALPASIGALLNLHELLATNNGLTSLPEGLFKLPLLRTLVLEGNALTELPDGLFSLPRLHTLNVSKNLIASLPDSLAAASELHSLNVGFNQLQALPACITRLPKLSTLIASHNGGVTALPSGISRLSQLSELQATHCGLRAVPQELAAAPKIKTLLLDPNPFDDKKLTKVLKEGRLKNTLTHIKKHGAPPSAAEEAAAAAAALARVQLAAAARRYTVEPVDKDAGLDVHVHAEVKGVRPHLVCAVLRGVDFAAHAGLLDAAIALQTSIHEASGKRAVAAIGTHDLAKLALPLQYEALPPGDISFVPLARDKDAAPPDDAADAAAAAAAAAAFAPGQAITAAQLPAYFAGDKSMLRYLSYIQDRPSKAAPLYAVLRDARGCVLSVSPVINSEATRIGPATVDMLLEVSSGESLEAAQKAAGEYLEGLGQAFTAAADGGALLSVAPVRMLTHGTGHVRGIWPPAK
ncbi:Lrrc47 [Scenedesmus sp. PABB004]|nr:Lrrc47 [Scenedesmus sp. PABB004]